MAQDLFSVRDRIAVITGGLGQLGREFALALLERGAKVAIFDLLASETLVAERFGAHRASGKLLAVEVDVTSRDSIEGALRKVQLVWGTPHALINNAALDSPPGSSIEQNGPFESYPEQSWDQVMAVNVKGVFLSCQIVGGAMAAARRGSIVNVSSVYGLVSPDQRIYEYRSTKDNKFFKPASYSASKSALLNLTRYLGTYWASQNVRVNAVTFGGVFNNQDEQFLKGYCSRVPLGRMARPDEYNGAIVFLLSDASSYVTGSNLVVDGGWTAW